MSDQQHKAMNSKDAQLDHLNYATSLSTNLIGFNPKDIAEYGLIAMIKVTAQMQNLRRGHTSQGFIKRVQIDQTSEGYANFMADGRMKLIAHDAEHAEEEVSKYESGKKSSPEEAAHKKFLDQRVIDAKKVYSQDVLKPEQDTYLTAEWDEMVPFPTSKCPTALLPSFARYQCGLTLPKLGNSALRATAYPLTAARSFPNFNPQCCQTPSLRSTSRRALVNMVAHLPMLRVGAI